MKSSSRIGDVKLINLPKFEDPRGNLSFLEELKHIPFKINRTYWIYDVPGGQVRGGHSFIVQEEFIIAISGSFDLVVNDGKESKTISLNRSYHGVYIPAGIWRQMENFSTNSVAVVVSSTQFDQNDYIREYNDFLNFKI
ncbi:sugar 3,4-ketoisomerase [Algoriphagus sp.]|uniref:sugar 3,4-ketoisomerase n=1 Tax=Algoriphagus sp. TaxID=1872435 RepID=UPI003919249A